MLFLFRGPFLCHRRLLLYRLQRARLAAVVLALRAVKKWLDRRKLVQLHVFPAVVAVCTVLVGVVLTSGVARETGSGPS